jgi:hypothetical protein
MPSLNTPVQWLRVAILPLNVPCSGSLTHSGEISTTGKSHGKKPDRFSLHKQTFEETSRCVRPERVNKWPNSMTNIWWWWWIHSMTDIRVWWWWILKQKRFLSRQSLVFRLLKQSSGTRATSPAFLDRRNDSDDPPTAQEEALPLKILTCICLRRRLFRVTLEISCTLINLAYRDIVTSQREHWPPLIRTRFVCTSYPLRRILLQSRVKRAALQVWHV